MRKNYIYIGLLLVICLFFGCEEKEVKKFNDEDGLYFWRGNWNKGESIQYDSLSHSFALLNSSWVRDTVYVDIRTMGFISDEDRPITLRQSNTGKANAAIPNTHYVAFDSEEGKKGLYIPAQQFMHYMPVILLRDPSLETQEVELIFEIVRNDYFNIGIEDQISFKITTTSQYSMPSNWSYWANSFGAWSEPKMKLIIDTTGFVDFENFPRDNGFVKYLAAETKKALEAYNAAHPDAPLRQYEPDGPIIGIGYREN